MCSDCRGHPATDLIFLALLVECFPYSIRFSADMMMATGWLHSQSFQTATRNLFLKPQIKKQAEEPQQILGGQANREGKCHPQLVLHYVCWAAIEKDF